MGCVREFACQVLTGEVQLFVQVRAPFRAIGHIVDNTFISDEFACAAFACIAAQFQFRDDVGRNVHAANYKEKSPAAQKIFRSDIDFSQQVASTFNTLQTFDRIPRLQRSPGFVHCSSICSMIYHVLWQFLVASTMRE